MTEMTEEVAEQEFTRFLEAMDLVPPDHLDDEDRKSFNDCKHRFIRACLAGKLVVNEDGEPEFTPDDGGGKIVFHEPNGASFMASDQKKKGHDVAKSLAALAAQTRVDAGRFAKMSNRDLRVCTAIQLLFLA